MIGLVCSGCYFFKLQDGAKHTGNCRRYPPQAFGVVVPQMETAMIAGRAVQGQALAVQVMTTWPQVQGLADYCGEYTPQAPLPVEE
jgi:hypothetical protein